MASSLNSVNKDEKECIEQIKPLLSNRLTEHWELQFATELLKEGQEAFKAGYCASASNFFERALNIVTKIFGSIHFECGKIYYLLGISELYRIPLSNDDIKLARIAVEADGYLESDDIIANSYNFKRGLRGGDFSLAWKYLKYARCCSNEDQTKLLITQVLAALGEASYRRGDEHAYVYYKEASSSIGGKLTATDVRRILLRFKTGICFKKVSKIEAMKYYEECLSLCKSREIYLKGRVRQGIESEFRKKLDLTNKLNKLIQEQIAGLNDRHAIETQERGLLNLRNKNPVSKESTQVDDPREFLKRKAKANIDRQLQEATTKSHPNRQNQTVQDTNQTVQKCSPTPQCCHIQ